MQIADAMVMRNVPSMPDRQLESMIAQGVLKHDDIRELVSRHVLTRIAGRVEFFHQTFFEYVAGFALAVRSNFSLDDCVAGLLEAANNRLEFPIREQQLWHCARSAFQRPVAIGSAVSELLIQQHPGPWGAALRLHLMADTGYGQATEYILEEIRKPNAVLLKRYCQLVHHLPSQRAHEVVDLIETAFQHRDWNTLQHTAMLFSWLAHNDWASCKRLLDGHDLIGELFQVAPSTVNVVRIVVDVLSAGLSTEPSYVLQETLRCIDMGRYKVTAEEFLTRAVPAFNDALASILATSLQQRAKDGLHGYSNAPLPRTALCLAALWSHFPSTYPFGEESPKLDEGSQSRLWLRALALADSIDLDGPRLKLFEDPQLPLAPMTFNLVLREFALPILENGSASPAIIESVTGYCIRVAERAVITSPNSPPRQSGDTAEVKVFCSFVRSLHDVKRCPPALQEWVSSIELEQWLYNPALLRLLPAAVADGLGVGPDILDRICEQPAAYQSQLDVLKGGLPSVANEPRALEAALRLSVVVEDAGLAHAAIDRASKAPGRMSLMPIIRDYVPRLVEVCQKLVTRPKSRSRKSAYFLLGLLVRLELNNTMNYSQILGWAQKDPDPDARMAVLSLLVSRTSIDNCEKTVGLLLDVMKQKGRRPRNQVVGWLRETLLIKDVRLSETTLDSLIEFALDEEATQAQACIAGGVLDVFIRMGQIEFAQIAALKLLDSETVNNFSATQKRTLGHHLDKPFQRLYRQLGESEIEMHIQRLTNLDVRVGRLVVVALCKSELSDREKWANRLITDSRISSSLRTIVDDYRQHLWK